MQRATAALPSSWSIPTLSEGNDDCCLIALGMTVCFCLFPGHPDPAVCDGTTVGRFDSDVFHLLVAGMRMRWEGCAARLDSSRCPCLPR
jgi:hypothetical protein